jgi:hypothetical protein
VSDEGQQDTPQSLSRFFLQSCLSPYPRHTVIRGDETPLGGAAYSYASYTILPIAIHLLMCVFLEEQRHALWRRAFLLTQSASIGHR